MCRFLSLRGGIVAAALVSCLAALPAAAQITQADFNESLDLPDFASSGPRLLQNLNVALPSAGPHLTSANQIANPSNWVGVLNVSFNATTNILSLTPSTPGVGYQTITVTLSDLVFALPGLQITGITPISAGNIVAFGNAPPPVPQTFFSATSFSVDYSVPTGDGDFYFLTAGTDTYQVSVGPLVAAGAPEPGTLALLGTGLGIAGLVVRRKR